MGRPRKPTKTKQLEGNPGKRALNTNEPRYEPDENARAPEFLGKLGAAEWRRVFGQMSDAGVLTKVNRNVLAACCSTYEKWRIAEEHIRTAEDMITTTPNGMEQQSPYVAIYNKGLALYVKLCAELGITPASLSKVSGGGDGEDDALMRFAQGDDTGDDHAPSQRG